MKHIKLFESFKSLYKKVSKEEFLSYEKKLEPFSNWEVSKLSSISKKWSVRRECELNIKSDNKIEINLGGRIFGKSIMIEKSRDDYFLVTTLPNDVYTFAGRNGKRIGHYRKYYICDQFDGLLSFLKKLDHNNDVSISDLSKMPIFSEDEIRMLNDIPNLQGGKTLSFIKVILVDDYNIDVKMSDISGVNISKVGEESYKCIKYNGDNKSIEIVDSMYKLMMLILGLVDNKVNESHNYFNIEDIEDLFLEYIDKWNMKDYSEIDGISYNIHGQTEGIIKYYRLMITCNNELSGDNKLKLIDDMERFISRLDKIGLKTKWNIKHSPRNFINGYNRVIGTSYTNRLGLFIF